MSLRRITMNHVGADAHIGPRAGRGSGPYGVYRGADGYWRRDEVIPPYGGEDDRRCWRL